MIFKADRTRGKQVLTFDKGAAASSFLCHSLVRGWGFLWELIWGVNFVHAIHGVLEERLGAVDGADNPRQGQRGPTVAMVHPGPVTHTLQLALHSPAQVALSPVVQALHAARCAFLCVICWRVDQSGR